jgi:hypothetical protein
MVIKRNRTHTKFNGKVYIFSSDFNNKSDAEKWAKTLREKGWLSRIAKLNEDTSKFPLDVLKSYKKDFPHGRWGVWARSKKADY